MNDAVRECADPEAGVVTRQRRDAQFRKLGMKRREVCAVVNQDAAFLRAQQNSSGRQG